MNKHSDSQPNPTTTAEVSGRMRKILPGLLALILLALPPAVHLNAQPVPVPALGTPAYQSTDFDPYFNTAGGSATQASWETLIDQARILLGAQWEAQVDATIGAHVAAVGQNDYFHTPQEYRDYLTKELHLQKQTAFAAWEAQADVQIEIQRESFLAALSERKKREALEDSEQTTEQADTTQVDMSDQQEDWENEFGDAVENGFQQFQSALGDVYSQYTSFLQTLADKEQEFEQNRLQIEAYEQTVRNGIQNTVYALDSYLQSNGLFREETCTTQGAAGTQSTSCTTDMATYNTAGTRLQTLITNLQDGLDNDTPLSTLATLMNDYLDQEHTDAITRRDYWGGLIRNSYTYSQGEYVTHGNPYHLADVQSAFQARNSGYANFTGLEAMIALKGDPRVVEGINWADMRGYSHNYIAGPDQVGHSNFQNEWYSTHGDNAFRFNWERRHTYLYACGIYVCQGSYTSHHTANESHLEIRAEYRWYDPNADHNNQIWGGYVDDMAPVLANWRDNIVPAIQNWEAQVATYTANHQAYLADAQTKRDAATTQFNTSINTLTESRNKWLSQMQEEFRKGRNEWVSMGRTARSANATPAITTAAVSEAASFENQIALLQKQAEASAASAPVPDASALDGLQSAFQKASKGIINLSLAATLNDQVVDQRTAITESIAAQIGANGLDGISEEKLREMAQKQADEYGGNVEEIMEAMRKDANDRQYDVRIDETGRIIATRQIKSGNVGGVTGDGTGYDNYTAEMMEQELVIAPPPAVQLVKTAGAFDDWDMNAYVNDHYDNQKDQTEVLENYNKYVAGEQEIADEQREVQDIIYNANVKASMTAAQNRKAARDQFSNLLNSVASAMMGGASLGDAYLEASNQQMSDEVARLTGIPSNFFNGVLNGQSWQSALTDATEFLVTDYVTKAVVDATGLPAGFISGIAGPGGLDMSGDGMKAAFQNYSEQLFAETLEEQTGIPGLGALALAKHKEHQAERERVDSERRALLSGNGLVMGAHLLRHTEVGREVTNQALGVLSGQTFGNALGVPPTLMSPLGGPTAMLYGQLGCKPCAAGSGLMPRNADELWEMTDDLGDIASGRTDGRDLAEKYDERIERAIAEDRAAIDNLASMNLGDLPGFIGSGISNSLSGVMGAVMGPITTLTNPSDDLTPEEIMVRESLAAQIGEATGQNQAYLMAVARGEDYDDAVYAQVYDDATTAIYGDNIPPQFRDQVVGAVRDYSENTLERLEFQRQRERAQKDPWNIWRNAEYGSEDQRMALRAAEVGAAVAITVATSGAAGPAAMAFMAGSAGTVITAGYIGYMAAKEGYTAYLRTGDKEAGYAGLVSGAANGALGYFTGGQGNVSLTYSDEDGFGGSFGYGINEGGFKAGGSVNWQEGEGITGVGLNAGYTVTDEESESEGVGLSGSLNFGPDGSFQGGSIANTFEGEQEAQANGGASSWNGSLGINFGHDFTATGVTANASLSSQNKDDDSGTKTAFNLGGGLTFNRDGTSSIDITNAVALTDAHEYGFNGAGANVTNTINFSPNGTYIDASQNISIDIKSQTKADAAKEISAAKDRQKARKAAIKAQMATATGAELKALEAEFKALEASVDRLEILHRQADIKYARLMRAIAKLEAKGDKEKLARLKADPSLLEDDKFRDGIFEGGEGDLKNLGDGDSYGNAITQWFGSVGGAIAGLFGHNSDGHGWVDDKGNYHERTCFVAGTLVRVHPETRGGFEQDGSWYKRIEEIEAGDLVLSWNEGSGEISFNAVAQTFVRDTELIYEITYANGTRVETTWNHPFYIDGRGWVQGKDLRVDDVSVAIMSANDERRLALTGADDAKYSPVGITGNASPHRIARIVKSARDEVVYNFEVAQDHTYFVTSADVLVHNQTYYEGDLKDELLARYYLGDRASARRWIRANIPASEQAAALRLLNQERSNWPRDPNSREYKNKKAWASGYLDTLNVPATETGSEAESQAATKDSESPNATDPSDPYANLSEDLDLSDTVLTEEQSIALQKANQYKGVINNAETTTELPEAPETGAVSELWQMAKNWWNDRGIRTDAAILEEARNSDHLTLMLAKSELGYRVSEAERKIAQRLYYDSIANARQASCPNSSAAAAQGCVYLNSGEVDVSTNPAFREELMRVERELGIFGGRLLRKGNTLYHRNSGVGPRSQVVLESDSRNRRPANVWGTQRVHPESEGQPGQGDWHAPIGTPLTVKESYLNKDGEHDPNCKQNGGCYYRVSGYSHNAQVGNGVKISRASQSGTQFTSQSGHLQNAFPKAVLDGWNANSSPVMIPVGKPYGYIGGNGNKYARDTARGAHVDSHSHIWCIGVGTYVVPQWCRKNYE